jgi:hypothetical protein
MTDETQPTNPYYEWWLRDWLRNTVYVRPDSHTQDVIDRWGATRRRQLTWAGLLERCVDEREVK